MTVLATLHHGYTGRTGVWVVGSFAVLMLIIIGVAFVRSRGGRNRRGQ